jgi:peptidoglycan/LPS O-acetylase OafA/YrhL
MSPTSATPPLTPGHLTHVEGMRALAAYVVFINHAYAQVWNGFRDQYPPKILSPLSYFLVAGHLSVTVFIVISGFCLTLPVVKNVGQLRGGTAEFLKRRARRILPPYYGAVAFCLFLIWSIIGKPTGSLWDVPIHVTTIAVVSHLLLLQDLFATSSINYVFWSIAVEWQIYFLFPLLVWSWRRYGPKIVVGGALSIGYGLRFAFAHTRLTRAAPHYIGLFALGMAAAYLARSGEPGFVRARERLPWGWMAILGFAAVCAMSWYWGFGPATTRFQYLDLPVALGTMSLLVLTSSPKRHAVTHVLSWKPLVFIGTFSYSVYLIHAPLLQILWQYVLRPIGLSQVAMFGALMVPGAAGVLGVSYLFFRIFEEPFMRHSSAKKAVSSDGSAERWAT